MMFKKYEIYTNIDNFFFFIRTSVLGVRLGDPGNSFLALPADAGRAARRCEFCLDHIKQWAIFIWELALLGRLSIGPPRRTTLHLRCMRVRIKSKNEQHGYIFNLAASLIFFGQTFECLVRVNIGNDSSTM